MYCNVPRDVLCKNALLRTTVLLAINKYLWSVFQSLVKDSKNAIRCTFTAGGLVILIALWLNESCCLIAALNPRAPLLSPSNFLMNALCVVRCNEASIPIVKNSDDVIFLQNIICGLSDRQKSLVISVDEVYVKPTLRYHGGTLFGKASNKPLLLANTLLAFVVLLLCGGPKYVCKMLPVKQLDAEFLFLQTQQILSGIKSAGGDTVSIM